MADRPILFSPVMVQALLAGRKTQTRRIIDFKGIEKVLEFAFVGTDTEGRPVYEMKDAEGQHVARPAGKHLVEYQFSPKFAVGDRLWVRETHYLTDDGDEEHAVYIADGNDATGEHLDEVASLERLHPSVDWSRHKKQRPSIHMPRWASRLTLTVTEVRLQRLQEITEEDVFAEGAKVYGQVSRFGPHLDGVMVETAQPHVKATPRNWYRELWDSLNAARGFGWDSNPWVVAVTFTAVKQNIDQVAA